eukprot:CAMPEP_0201284310 /NCGR_PEP_ID=MMETSP1317-20130820/69590_1 /ASSEMBLY_ACC=CAM_ASM_000770 /TAXON_ID=187299 /ORGANISM="Undescribed Undescribed, Strain Undescribed" /LENGTH=194 /DNA_ID=CAMNT_0047603903 /DNA_START=5 /DNA_END=584 /DNA_ORIENTATION=+
MAPGEFHEDLKQGRQGPMIGDVLFLQDKEHHVLNLGSLFSHALECGGRTPQFKGLKPPHPLHSRLHRFPHHHDSAPLPAHKHPLQTAWRPSPVREFHPGPEPPPSRLIQIPVLHLIAQHPIGCLSENKSRETSGLLGKASPSGSPIPPNRSNPAPYAQAAAAQTDPQTPLPSVLSAIADPALQIQHPGNPADQA